MFDLQRVSGSGAQPGRLWHLLVLSAPTVSELETTTTELLHSLKAHPTVEIADVARNLLLEQKLFACRRAIVCKNIDDAISVLQGTDPKRVLTVCQEERERQVIFLFPGSGSQYVYMGFGLYRTEPLFRELVDACAEILKARFGFDLREILYPPREQVKQAAKLLNQTSFGSLALFVIEYALTKLLLSFGVIPSAMLGHSLGEYVAACLADVFSLEDALILVFTRGQLLERLPAGAMLTVTLSEQKIQAFLNQHLSLAAVNSPNSCVVSGTTDAIAALEAELATQNIEYLKLGIGVAGHSQQMHAVASEFVTALEHIELKPPRMPYVSNVTGTWIAANEATDPAFWVQHVCQTVRFADGLGTLLTDPQAILLEVGPGLTLTSFARQHPARTPGQLFLPALRHLYERTSDTEFLMQTLSKLWLAGVKAIGEKLYMR